MPSFISKRSIEKRSCLVHSRNESFLYASQEYLTDFAESARDALLALEVARTQPHENKVVNTEDLGSYAVLAHSISSKVLESLHDKVLAPLIQADKRGHDYLTTLNTYLARSLSRPTPNLVSWKNKLLLILDCGIHEQL